jgi:hypothetical protein
LVSQGRHLDSYGHLFFAAGPLGSCCHRSVHVDLAFERTSLRCGKADAQSKTLLFEPMRT